MVATCLYKGIAKGKTDWLYWCCLPFGYIALFLLLYFGTDLSLGIVSWTSILVGDTPGILIYVLVAGIIEVVRLLIGRSTESSRQNASNSAGQDSTFATEDQ